MNTHHLHKSEIESFKNKLKFLVEKYSDAFVLDSCQLNAPLGIGKYDLIAGFGAKRTFKAFSSNLNLYDLSDFLKKGSWHFGVLSYELRRQIEHLDHSLPSCTPVPELHFIEPELVVTIDRNGILSSFGRTNLFNEVDSFPTLNDLEFEIASKVKKVTSVSRADYLRNIEVIKEQIIDGNVYELNYCYTKELLDLYLAEPYLLQRKLLQRSPVPFGAYVKSEDLHLMCASPERFLYNHEGMLVSQPIKGTARRDSDPYTDEKLKRELFNSEKERAENVMIVDLVRNDMAKCSEVGSVHVEELFGIHSYAQVHQMVSTIKSELKEGVDLVNVLKACYPMGSMTGAPKIAAMEAINQLEVYQRGWYSGSVGYVDPEGNFDFNVVIRSMIYNERTKSLNYSVGSAITIDSDASQEYLECELKASAIEGILGLPRIKPLPF